MMSMHDEAQLNEHFHASESFTQRRDHYIRLGLSIMIPLSKAAPFLLRAYEQDM